VKIVRGILLIAVGVSCSNYRPHYFLHCVWTRRFPLRRWKLAAIAGDWSSYIISANFGLLLFSYVAFRTVQG